MRYEFGSLSKAVRIPTVLYETSQLYFNKLTHYLIEVTVDDIESCVRFLILNVTILSFIRFCEDDIWSLSIQDTDT